MKRIVSLVLALSMVLSMFSFAFAGTALPDVEATDYEAAVSALVELGIVNGYEDGTYKPTKTVTRAEMAKFLVVSAGLEPAAEVSKGATSFSDVSADHWASGYINVATEYGYINGYPDGTFHPDDTVSYAEAVTMAIRVLGYKSVVEAKGTWPTNYIAKAQELKVLEDVEYGKYTEGATRGNVALLMWNMLTTNMWDVESENESNGLTYGKSRTTMIDKYFDDYTYIDEDEEYVVVDIDVEDGKVEITLESDEEETLEYELARDVEFLNVFGRTVSLLYNDKDEEVVMLTVSNSDKVKADYKEELEEDYKFTKAEEYTWGEEDENANLYTVAVLGSNKNVDYATYFNAKNSFVVKETKSTKDTLKITTAVEENVKITNEDAIVLIDGEWASREDIKAGDVVTVLIADELYVVNRETVEGSFDDASEDFIKVEGKKYEYLLTDGLFEFDESKDEFKNTITKEFAALDNKSKYFDEDCTVYLNFLGEVVRVEFEEIKDEDDGNFYVLTNAKAASWESSDESGITRYIELNGEKYEVKTTSDDLDGFDYDTLVAGSVVFVTFDKKDRVVDIEVAQTVAVDEDNNVTFDTTTSTITTDEETYNLKLVEEELDDNYVGTYKISSSTTVFTITPVEDDDDDIESYDVEITKGQSALKGIEESVIVYRKGSTVASYAFVLEDAKNTDVQFGLIDEDGVESGKRTPQVTIDGKTYTIDEDEKTTLSSADEGKVIAFIDDEDGIRIKKLFAVADVEDYVGNRITLDEDDDRIFAYDTKVIDLDDEKYEDYTFVLVSYDYDDKEFTDVNTYTADKVPVDDDYLYVGGFAEVKDTIYMIKGYEFAD